MYGTILIVEFNVFNFSFTDLFDTRFNFFSGAQIDDILGKGERGNDNQGNCQKDRCRAEFHGVWCYVIKSKCT